VIKIKLIKIKDPGLYSKQQKTFILSQIDSVRLKEPMKKLPARGCKVYEWVKAQHPARAYGVKIAVYPKS
jgi:hypothetical protein